MSRRWGGAAFALGLGVVLWVGFGYRGANPLALTMTALIGAFYLMGALELRRFDQATSGLKAALAALPERLPNLGDWLVTLDPSLQNAVRLRIEGERVGLPGPVMTPYLVGLLVLLGMLGTFLGMVVTLDGAVRALETTTDLPTIRAALAAPVKGLGLAFGTSVAGVAASAMLGLVSALCRRERLQAAQVLDARTATTLRVFSQAHQREETLKALQAQARVMPEVMDRMQALMAQLERQGEGLNERLLAGQDRFHHSAQAAYVDLASSVDRSLKDSLTESARLAGAVIQPVVQATMAGIARETAVLQERMAGTVQQSLDRHIETFERGATSLLATVDRAHAALQADAVTADQQRVAADQQRLAAWTAALAAMATSLQREWQSAGAQAVDQQAQICRTLEQTARDMHAQAEAHARSTIAEMSRLIAAASEAPRAAAEVVAELRQRLSDSLLRDNGVLEERSRIMATLSTLLAAVNQAATEQRGAIDALVSSSAALLQQAGSRFSDQVEAESARMVAAAAQVTGSAVEVSSLGEAFGVAVQLFSESSGALTTHLQRIEAALSKSTARSDEQLGYYVAQAREIIDLSISSQRQIVEDLQQLAIRQRPLVGEGA
jgi:hypothetical protein